MKKIPTLFEREFSNHKVISIKPIVIPGFEWVLNGEGIATIKFDGAPRCKIKRSDFGLPWPIDNTI